MDDEPIDLPLSVPPKKPYVRPQLHELTGENADGKANHSVEVYGTFGPS